MKFGNIILKGNVQFKTQEVLVMPTGTVVQTALNDDIYRYVHWDNDPTPGNLLVAFYTYGYTPSTPGPAPTGWTLLEQKNWSNGVDGIGVMYRTVTAQDVANQKQLWLLNTNTADGGAAVFELSGVDGSMIDSYGLIMNSSPYSVSATVTPTTKATFVVGMALPAVRPGVAYPQSVSGADMYLRMDQYGNRDDINTEHAPVAFKTQFTGLAPHPIVATYGAENTYPLNMGYVAFRGVK